MSNSKRRCHVCKLYSLTSEMHVDRLGAVCEDCRGIRVHRKPSTLKPRKRKPKDDPNPTQKARIRNRDHNACRVCGKPESRTTLEVHHITYRSEGGKHLDVNLITLCSYCHADVVHAKKRYWQPLLRATVWCIYTEWNQGAGTTDRVVRYLTQRNIVWDEEHKYWLNSLTSEPIL